MMPDTLKSLRALADGTRLRLLALLEKDELSVNELQEITPVPSRSICSLALFSKASSEAFARAASNGLAWISTCSDQ